MPTMGIGGVIAMLALGLLGCNPSAARKDRVGMNEVSLLFPMPRSAADENALGFDAQGRGGALLTRERFAHLTEFVDPALAYENWRIVAARIDPCFPSATLMQTEPSSCRRQVRLVAQPLDLAESRPLFADSAIHLFYDLSESDFLALARAIHALGDDALGDPSVALGVHPTMAREGLSGPYATSLRSLIAQYAGAGNQTQITFMLGIASLEWRFGGFVVSELGVEALEIADLHPNAQIQTVRVIGAIPPPIMLVETSATTEALRPLAGERVTIGGGAIGFAYTASDQEIAAAQALAFRIEDPTSEFSPTTLDCVSCHIAGRARERASGYGHSTEGMPRFSRAGFKLGLDAEDPNANNVQMLRAFGFNRDQPALGERTVNESALVAEAVAALIAAED